MKGKFQAWIKGKYIKLLQFLSTTKNIYVVDSYSEFHCVYVYIHACGHPTIRAHKSKATCQKYFKYFFLKVFREQLPAYIFKFQNKMAEKYKFSIFPI